jgi:hypothetical protein
METVSTSVELMLTILSPRRVLQKDHTINTSVHTTTYSLRKLTEQLYCKENSALVMSRLSQTIIIIIIIIITNQLTCFMQL